MSPKSRNPLTIQFLDLGITLLILSLSFVLSNGVTVDDINQLRIELREEFDANTAITPGGVEYRALLATTVRLSFHDCSGPGEAGSTEKAQCNGCVDFQNDDHAGLQKGAVEPLNEIWKSGWNSLMSRADFFAAAGTIAIEYAQELANDDDLLRDIPYYFGREDCGDDTGDAVDTKSFVSAKGGWEDTKAWFQDNLGWTEQQIVAIMGAHTLGVAHSDASGFSDRPWVSDPGTLNNQYYIDLVDVEANQFKSGTYTNGWQPLQASNGHYEWVNQDNALHPYLMFNADMCIWYDIDSNMVDESTGRVNAKAYDIDSASPVRYLTWEYVQDNQKWLDDFADIWEIMIQTGYSSLERVDAGNGRGIGGSGPSDSGGSGGYSTGGSTRSNNRGGGKTKNKSNKTGGRGGGKKRGSAVGIPQIGDESPMAKERRNNEWWERMQNILGWMICITGIINIGFCVGMGVKKWMGRYYEYQYHGSGIYGGEMNKKVVGYESVSSLEH